MALGVLATACLHQLCTAAVRAGGDVGKLSHNGTQQRRGVRFSTFELSARSMKRLWHHDTHQ